MTEFAYTALTSTGQKIKGVSAAGSATQLSLQLQKKSMTLKLQGEI